MVEIYDIADLHILDRYAQREGYSGLGEYMPYLQSLSLSVSVAAELVRKGISLSEHVGNPQLVKEELPEGVVDIFDLYRARDEHIAQERIQALEERVVQPVPSSVKRGGLRTLLYAAVAALSLIELSHLPHKDDIPFSEASLIYDPLCSSVEGLYVCLDTSEHGQFFGSYWEYKNLHEGK